MFNFPKNTVDKIVDKAVTKVSSENTPDKVVIDIIKESIYESIISYHNEFVSEIERQNYRNSRM